MHDSPLAEHQMELLTELAQRLCEEKQYRLVIVRVAPLCSFELYTFILHQRLSLISNTATDRLHHCSLSNRLLWTW